MSSVVTGLTRAFLTFGSATAAIVQQQRWALPSSSSSSSASAPTSSIVDHKARTEAILNFWFGGEGWKEDPPRVAMNYDLWFGGTAETDKAISDLFGEDVRRAQRGEYNRWMSAGPLECLALILLLDQFALNVYRDRPEGYLASETAIPIAYTAIARGYPRSPTLSTPAASSSPSPSSVVALPSAMRMFFYLPLLQDQEECVRLYKQMAVDKGADAEEEAQFAIPHRDIIAKYGRFPGRNKVMGRESSAEELKYLSEGGIF